MISIPLRLVSEANQREFWAKRYKRKVAQQRVVMAFRQQTAREVPDSWPVHVCLTRVAPKAMDSDNLAGAFKHTRDAIAKVLGVDDGDVSKVAWSYARGAREYTLTWLDEFRSRGML